MFDSRLLTQPYIFNFILVQLVCLFVFGLVTSSETNA